MISIIHNTYEFNEFIRESVILNVRALEESGLEYQYIIFNDGGDRGIEQSINDILSSKVEYVYSAQNHGMGVCSGGWIGALPYLKGDYIHNTGQDDVFSTNFYTKLVAELQTDGVYLAYANGFVVNEDLSLRGGATMGPLQPVDYTNPKEVFDMWFQRRDRVLTSANNFIPAPGVIYKRALHNEIGLPDLNNFKGSADFEYWARVLFYNKGVSYIWQPLWLYRMSKHSAGSKPTANTSVWNSLILQKYQKLIENE